MNLDGIIEDLPNKNTPLCKATFEKMCNAILDKVYPIGISIMFHDNEDHSNFLGLTWERELVGLTPVGYNPNDNDFKTIGKTGGEKTHKLTIEEMPKHTHNPTVLNKSDNGYNNDPNFEKNTRYIDLSATPNFVGEGVKGYTSSVATSNTGGDKSHNNMPPYKVVAYWKRVA